MLRVYAATIRTCPAGYSREGALLHCQRVVQILLSAQSTSNALHPIRKSASDIIARAVAARAWPRVGKLCHAEQFEHRAEAFEVAEELGDD